MSILVKSTFFMIEFSLPFKTPRHPGGAFSCAGRMGAWPSA